MSCSELLTACATPIWTEADAQAWWERHLPLTSSLRSFAQDAVVHPAGRPKDLSAFAVQTACPHPSGDGGRGRDDRAPGRGQGRARRRRSSARGRPTALPAMVITTAVAVVVAVPIYARLLARFGPRVVVPVGFLAQRDRPPASSGALPVANPWVAVAIYLHIAGFGALLLSGFWSLISELFDPQTAKASYGRIAAAGTLGGLAGGLGDGAARARRRRCDAAADARGPACRRAPSGCSSSVGWRRSRRPAGDAARKRPAASCRSTSCARRRISGRSALMVVLSTAGAAVVDYLFKSEGAEAARRTFTTAPSCSSSSRCSTPSLQLDHVRRADRRRAPACAASGSAGRSPILPAGLGVSSVARAAVPGVPDVRHRARRRVGAARLVLPQRLRAAVRADGPRREAPHQDVSRRHVRSRRRRRRRAHRAARALHVAVEFQSQRAAGARHRAGRGRPVSRAPARHAVPRRRRAPPGPARRAHADRRRVGDRLDRARAARARRAARTVERTAGQAAADVARSKTRG